MPQEDEVTSYVSCTSGTTNSVSESDNESVGKGSDSVIVGEEEVPEVINVPKNANIPRENCILVEPDENVVVKQKAQVVKPQFPKESEDPFFKKQFVKQSQHPNVKGKSNQFQENKYPHQHVRFQSRGSYQHVPIVRKFVERRKCFHFDEQGYIYDHCPYKAEGKRFVDPSLAKPFNEVSGNSQGHGSDSLSIKKFAEKNVVSQEVSRVKENVS
ncbi:hypothetical protein L1987_15247 [Smallanthus sonchifolius]|uniref:Uncharacterized protein n=1 Tax=Smallanthus sonchifolius TaxID=185202 RepID=A0ACB9J735_9ASTR|nr:hypothetical protein L1987_15247 [Smallanthus sonchifolius]